MAWSNKADRDRLSVEKGHSLSLSVRVEDRLHQNLLQPTDELWFTVRPDSYSLGVTDLDATISVAGVQTSTPFGPVFRVDVQAAQLNLDPELEHYYDITYITDGYSVSLLGGELEVAANVTNRGAGETFTGGNGVFSLVATVAGRNLLHVTRSLPTAAKGDPGAGSFTTTTNLPAVVGQIASVPAGTIGTYGRPLKVGDILFSTTSPGVLAVVTSLVLSGGGISAVEAETRQVYGLNGLKAILDTAPRPESATTIDSTWTVLKSAAPLPPGYSHQLGDMVFSQASNPGALDKYLTVALVTGMDATTLTVQTKIVFPMFADIDVIQDLLDAKVSKTQTVNGVALTGPHTTVNADSVPDGTAKVVMTVAERNKLSGVATGATQNQTNAHLLNRGNHTGEQAMSTVTGLAAALASRPQSSTVSNIWSGTQAQYDQIVTKDPNTLYFIKVG